MRRSQPARGVPLLMKRPWEKPFCIVSNHSMGLINEVILIDMEENGKNTGTSLVSSGCNLSLREPTALFLPNGTAGSTASLPWGQYNLGGKALGHSYLRLHSYGDNEGFTKSTALAHARLNQSQWHLIHQNLPEQKQFVRQELLKQTTFFQNTTNLFNALFRNKWP